jgi:ATP-dependent protease ClpP protease subunit
MKYLEQYKPITMYESIYKEMLSRRILYINDEISDLTIDMVATPIQLLNQEEVDTPTEKLKPLKIMLNSPGGDAGTCLYIIDVIKNSRIPIHCEVMSMAASAGLYICVACHKRVAHPNSMFLLHKGSVMVSGSAGAAEDFMDFYKDEVGHIFDNLIIERTKITPDELSRIRRHETYCLANRALELGFIDEII